jgi:hypothetical protein
MPSVKVYPQAQAAFSAGEIDWPNEAGLKMALMGTGFSFDDTHDSWADISANDYGSGTGYTPGGEALTTKAVAETDSSALTARANTTAYVVGDLVRTAADSGRVFYCVAAGTSAASEPGGMATLAFLDRITDGTVVWVNVGSAITVYDSDLVAWTGLDQTGTPAAVIYNDDGVNEPLVCAIIFDSTQTPTQITVTPPGPGWFAAAAGGAI